jgi:MFS family permease
MMEIFPPHQLGMVQAIFGIGIMVGPTVGPTLGGWITDNYRWPWIFFINLPIGIAATILTYLFVHNSKHKRSLAGGVDFIGIGFLAIGLGALQTVLEKGNHEGWFESSFITWLTIAAVVSLVSFVIWELRTPHPAVNLRILKNPTFAAGTIFATVVGFGLFGGTFVLPVFLQQIRHYTAQQTGLIMLPGAIPTTVMMPIIGKLVSRVSARNLTAIGTFAFMVRHIVMWRFKDSAEGKTKQENMQYIKDKLYALKDLIPEIKNLEVGMNINKSETAYDMVLVSVFEDIEALSVACHFTNCRHREEPRCAVKAAAAEGGLSPARLASYLKLQEELSRLADKRRR